MYAIRSYYEKAPRNTRNMLRGACQKVVYRFAISATTKRTAAIKASCARSRCLHSCASAFRTNQISLRFRQKCQHFLSYFRCCVNGVSFSQFDDSGCFSTDSCMRTIADRAHFILISRNKLHPHPAHQVVHTGMGNRYIRIAGIV